VRADIANPSDTVPSLRGTQEHGWTNTTLSITAAGATVRKRPKHTWLNEIRRELLGGEFRDVVVFSSVVCRDVGQFRLAPSGGHPAGTKSSVTDVSVRADCSRTFP